MMQRHVAKKIKVVSKNHRHAHSFTHLEQLLQTLSLSFVGAFGKRILPSNVSPFAKKAISLFVIVLLVGVSARPLLLQADTVLFYPATCLGGWQMPSQASGKPDANGSLNETNSAFLPRDTHAELYCGGFKGDFEQTSKPTDIQVLLEWGTVSTPSSSSVSPETTEIISNDFASSTQEILDATDPSVSFTYSSSTEPSTLEAPEETAATPSETSAEPPVTTEEIAPQQVEPTPTEEPVSFLKATFTSFVTLIIPVAHAEETSTVEEVPLTVTPAEEPVESLVQKEEVTVKEEVQALEEITTDQVPTTDQASTTEEAPVVEVQEEETVSGSSPAFELSYTLDGSVWNLLASIPAESLGRQQYTLSSDGSMTWDDLHAIQFKITRVTTFDDVPTVYLDGVELQISHEPIEKGSLLDALKEVASSTLDSFTSDGSDNLKGISASTLLLREKIEDVYKLALYNLETGEKKYIDIDIPIAKNFPVGVKDGYMFILSEARDVVVVYSLADETVVTVPVASFDPSNGERASVFVEGFPWTVYVSSANFSFYSEYTGEVFSDDDSSFINRLEDGTLVTEDMFGKQEEKTSTSTVSEVLGVSTNTPVEVVSETKKEETIEENKMPEPAKEQVATSTDRDTEETQEILSHEETH